MTPFVTPLKTSDMILEVRNGSITPRFRGSTDADPRPRRTSPRTRICVGTTSESWSDGSISDLEDHVGRLERRHEWRHLRSGRPQPRAGLALHRHLELRPRCDANVRDVPRHGDLLEPSRLLGVRRDLHGGRFRYRWGH